MILKHKHGPWDPETKHISLLHQNIILLHPRQNSKEQDIYFRKYVVDQANAVFQICFFCDSNKFYSMGMQMVKYELSTVRAVLTAANKNVAARRFSATFQLFRQLLFRRRPGFLQVFLFTLSTTCLYHPCIFYCTRQAFKC